jgi:hypothetical protein
MKHCSKVSIVAIVAILIVIGLCMMNNKSEGFIQENCVPCAAAFAAYKNGMLCNYLPPMIKVASGNKDSAGKDIMITVNPNTDCLTVTKAVDAKTMSIPNERQDPVTKRMIPNWTPSVQAALINFATYIDDKRDRPSQIMNQTCKDIGLCSSF